MRKLEPHRNRGMEVTYVPKGELRWFVDGRVEVLPPGSVFFTLPWQAHGSCEEHEPGNLMQWLLFKLDKDYTKPAQHFAFHPELDFPVDESRRLSAVFCAASRHSWPASPEIAWLIPALIRELETSGCVSQTYVQGLFRSMMIELGRIVVGEKRRGAVVSSAERKVRQYLVQLSEALERPWALDEMAQACGLKRTRFSALVKKITGDSPITYLNRLRIRRACAQLQHTDRPVIDIALDCGFCSSQYFSKVFRQFTDRSPARYRKKQQTAAREFFPGGDPPWRSEAEEHERARRLLCR